MDNSVDPSSQSTEHAEAFSVIVERVDTELATFLPPLADCESTSSVMRLTTAIFATSFDVRVKEEMASETGDLPMVETIVADSGIFRIFAG